MRTGSVDPETEDHGDEARTARLFRGAAACVDHVLEAVGAVSNATVLLVVTDSVPLRNAAVERWRSHPRLAGVQHTGVKPLHMAWHSSDTSAATLRTATMSSLVDWATLARCEHLVLSAASGFARSAAIAGNAAVTAWWWNVRGTAYDADARAQSGVCTPRGQGESQRAGLWAVPSGW